MRDLNHLSMTGRLTKDPEFKYLPNGKALAKFTLANNRGTDREGHSIPPFFFDCEVWGKGAEIIRQHANKGKQILIEGRMIQKKWTTEAGEKRQRVGINVDQFYFMGAKPEKKKPAADDQKEPPFVKDAESKGEDPAK